MLDNVLQHFIDYVVDGSFPNHNEYMKDKSLSFEQFKTCCRKDRSGYIKAAYSAYRERSLGLGAMGFHSYLQKNSISFEGMYAASFNHKSFSLIKDRAAAASRSLAVDRGEAPDMTGSGKRNAHLLAVAPNASSSIICGVTSPSIEPFRANTFTHKTLSGSFRVKNKYLDKVLNELITTKAEREKAWKNIAAHDGSVQQLDILSNEIKEVFKTAPELNQIWIIEHASSRQKYICQSQSVNLFFIPPKSTADQETHNEYLQYVNDVHWAGAKNLKSMYYLRSDAARGVENVNIKIPKINLEDEGCLSCEG
jgi:ribonucleoside-diphosphate reductase alpha chain